MRLFSFLLLFILSSCDAMKPRNTVFFAELNVSKWHQAGKRINPKLENLTVATTRENLSAASCDPGEFKGGKAIRRPKLTINLSSLMKSPMDKQGMEVFEEMVFCSEQYDEEEIKID